MFMLKVSNITKIFGDIISVDDMSFTVKKGEIIGLLGSNGAGKSTTMNMITGYLPMTQGSIDVFGYDIVKNPKQAKKRIGYLPEIPPLYLDMTVSEQLGFVCSMKTIAKAEIEKEILRVCNLANILDVKDRMIKNLSKGYRQRVGVAQALIGSPELCFW
jgi:ABC-2 type transport system ATP-binding protein